MTNQRFIKSITATALTCDARPAWHRDIRRTRAGRVNVVAFPSDVTRSAAAAFAA